MAAPGISTTVRFNDVAAGYDEQRAEIDAALAAVLRRGDFINGLDVAAFEREFAAWCGLPHAVGTSNGTSALHLALVAAGVGPGDEVIVPAMTFIATSEAVAHAGARPVFADIDAATLNLDAGHAATLVTPRTKAIVFVHLHGSPAGVHEAGAMACRHGLHMIEDCAQAHGAEAPPYPGTPGAAGPDPKPLPVGHFGVAGCFSFFPAKNLGAFGDAGAVVTADADRALLMARMANHGRAEKYLHLMEGWNYRLDTIQAAVLRAKLPALRGQVARRARLAARYREALAGLPLAFQAVPLGHVHALHLFVILVDRRDELQAWLKARGIETGIHYPIALHRQPAYAALGMAEGSLPAAESTARRSLSLPMYPQLPDDHVDRVCEAIRLFFAP